MNDQKNTIRVFIVDDDNLTIELLRKAFLDISIIEFAGKANSGEECLEKLKFKPVDLVVMDINMPGIDGIETAIRLLEIKKEDAPKIIFLTVYGDFTYARKALEIKASLLGKNIGISSLISTIQRVWQGELIINPNPNGIINESNHDAKLNFVLKTLLTEEQIKIAILIRNGQTAGQIAADFGKDEIHINNQKKEIYKKLKPLSENINAALLGAIIERSGLCDPIEFKNINQFLPPLSNS